MILNFFFLRGNPTLCARNEGDFIDFINEKWTNILKFGFAYIFLQVYMKIKLINFLKTKWRRKISRKEIRFFLAVGPLPVTILHIEQKTKKILKIYIKWSEHRMIFSKFRFFENFNRKIVKFNRKNCFRKQLEKVYRKLHWIYIWHLN